jgi:hypothetical protein
MNKLNTDKLIMGMMTASGASYDEVCLKLKDYYDSESDSDSESESDSDYDSDGSIDLETMTLAQLKEECEFVGVSTKGTKAKLRERLWAWDDSNVDGTKEDVVTPYEPRAKPKAKAKPGPKPKAKPGPKPKAKPGPKPKAKCASS